MKRLCKGRLSLKKSPELDPRRHFHQRGLQNFGNAELDEAKVDSIGTTKNNKELKASVLEAFLTLFPRDPSFNNGQWLNARPVSVKREFHFVILIPHPREKSLNAGLLTCISATKMIVPHEN